MALQEELKKQGDFLFKNRSYLPLIILLIGLGVYINTEYLGIEEATETWFTKSYKFICLGICLFGLLIRIITVGHSPKNTSGRNTKEGQIADVLNTTGLYSLVRHPLYVGNFFIWLGVAMLTENSWFIIAFILFYAFYYERIMYAEESFLRNKFGKHYLDWANNVPAFIPTFKNYKRHRHSFRIKKVLKKEKNGLTAIFLLFWFFEFIGETVENRKIVMEYDFWFYSALVSLMIYFILKTMKKRKLLN
ncbi:methyltransferase family protein [Jejuia spongiicola]|uniref:Isoprenylcysteine carboxylmethyltransferase family protein n=1 Tax=Jejuia spongiicola TaxID=2942207 RepID=A0ABT0QAR2_9FLAO|nr:isoprenylcysteine carboxylmethyltransferase family protein [Jejuia spongiicola]MCL6294071.1 isoprenylcysteine carboxylmethyltransferase family protein [Jejuia spongiicola]